MSRAGWSSSLASTTRLAGRHPVRPLPRSWRRCSTGPATDRGSAPRLRHRRRGPRAARRLGAVRRRAAQRRHPTPSGCAAHPVGPGPLAAWSRAAGSPDGPARRRAPAQPGRGRQPRRGARRHRLPRRPGRDLAKADGWCAAAGAGRPCQCRRPQPEDFARRCTDATAPGWPTWSPARCSPRCTARSATSCSVHGRRARPHSGDRTAPDPRPAGRGRPGDAESTGLLVNRVVEVPRTGTTSTPARPASASTLCSWRWRVDGWRPAGSTSSRPTRPCCALPASIWSAATRRWRSAGCSPSVSTRRLPPSWPSTVPV